MKEDGLVRGETLFTSGRQLVTAPFVAKHKTLMVVWMWHPSVFFFFFFFIFTEGEKVSHLQTWESEHLLTRRDSLVT